MQCVKSSHSCINYTSVTKSSEGHTSVPEWNREYRRKTESINSINRCKKVVHISCKNDRQCYSCGRTAHVSMMSVCNNCGSLMCMKDEDCKAYCLCDLYQEAAQAR